MENWLPSGKHLFSQRFRIWLIGGLLLVVAVVSIGVLLDRSSDDTGVLVRDSSVLEQLEERLRHDPLNRSLLLRAARSYYGYVRYRLRQNDAKRSAVRPFLERGLGLYRRLLVGDRTDLHRRDFFYLGYLYHQFGNQYHERALTMALRAYNEGFRSPELITLLANLHYRKGNYDVALNFYRSLGPNLNDPVLVYNKAMTLRALGRNDRARGLLRRHLQRENLSLTDSLGRRYTRALVGLEMDRGRYRRALNMINNTPAGARDLQLRTMRARCLMELGQTARARGELEEVVKHSASPEKARDMLDRLTAQTQERRS